jgi:CRISPR-associated protein Cas6
MTTYDLLFPVVGDTLPTDHAYPLYAALSRLAPRFHDRAGEMRFAAITGELAGAGRIGVTTQSRLRVRTTEDALPATLKLAGKRLDLGGSTVRLGAPTVAPLRPAPTLQARLVTFKHSDTPERFLATARSKLVELGVEGEPAIPLMESGPRAGQPRRRVVRVKGKAVVGYALLVSGLTAWESIRLQEAGLGGRTRIGCGFFLPVRERGA